MAKIVNKCPFKLPLLANFSIAFFLSFTLLSFLLKTVNASHICNTSYPSRCDSNPQLESPCGSDQAYCEGTTEPGVFCRACVTRSTSTSQTCSGALDKPMDPSTCNLSRYTQQGITCGTGTSCSNRYADGCYGCAAPVCNLNGEQDNGEVGRDCGGGGCPACPQACNSNGIQDNGETGIDCGGGGCGACPPDNCLGTYESLTYRCQSGSSCPTGWSRSSTRFCGGRPNETCCFSGQTPDRPEDGPCTAYGGQPTCNSGSTPTARGFNNNGECTINLPPCPPVITPQPGTCSVSVQNITQTSATASVNMVSGRNKVNWYINNNSAGTNDGPGASFSGLSPNTNYTVTATEWDANGTNSSINCTAGSFRTGTDGSPTPTSPPTAAGWTCWQCTSGGGFDGSPKWSNRGDDCSSVCPSGSGRGCQGTDPNNYPPREGGVCYIQPGSVSTGSNLVGRFVNRDTNQTILDGSFGIDYWLYDGSCYGGIPQYVNGALAYCRQRQPWSPSFDYNISSPVISSPSQDRPFQLYNWPTSWRPVSYVNYQEWTSCTSTYECTRSRAGVGSDNPCGDGCEECLERDPDCSSQRCVGGVNSNDHIRRGNLGNLQRGTYSTITHICNPVDSQPRVDITWARDTASIQGIVFVDYNGDGIKNGDDSSYGGARVYLYTPSTAADYTTFDTTDASATNNYSFTDQTPNQSYKISLDVPSGYRVTTTNPNIINNLSGDQTVNFGITPIANAWFQTKDADLFSLGSIISRIPLQCQVDTGCDESLSLIGSGGFPGVPIYNSSTAPNFGYGRVSSLGWMANSGTTVVTQNYAYFAARMPAGGYEVADGAIAYSGYFSSNGTADPRGYKWFKREGDLTLDANFNLNNGKAVLFVNGNVIIKQKITINGGGAATGFFALIASGNINIDPGVTYQAQPAPRNNAQPALEGIFLANGQIKTGTANPSNDSQLYVRGVLAGLQSVALERNLDRAQTSTGNNTTPAEFVEYAPDIILNLPPELLRDNPIWEEVAP